MSPEDRLREFGIELPVVPALDGRRLKGVVVTGSLAFVSSDGDGAVQGYVGSGGMAVEVEAIVALA
jgi:hypothetical protein